MGLFSGIKNAVTGPFRAVGQLVQGKPRGFLGALGDTIRPVATVAAAIPGPHQAFAIPAAAAGGMMQKFDDEGDRDFESILGGGTEGALMATGARLAPGAIDRLGGVSGITGYMKAHPDQVLAAAGMGADIYGAQEQGRVYDEQRALDEKDREERRRLERFRAITGMMSSFRPRGY